MAARKVEYSSIKQFHLSMLKVFCMTSISFKKASSIRSVGERLTQFLFRDTPRSILTILTKFRSSLENKRIVDLHWRWKRRRSSHRLKVKCFSLTKISGILLPHNFLQAETAVAMGLKGAVLQISKTLTLAYAHAQLLITAQGSSKTLPYKTMPRLGLNK